MSDRDFPLQYAPLFEARRLGTITYRRLMIANDEVKPRGGEDKVAASAIMDARGEADPAALAVSGAHSDAQVGSRANSQRVCHAGRVGWT